MHPKFCRELLRKVKEAGIHTAIETAGNVPGKNIVEVVPYTDLFCTTSRRWMMKCIKKPPASRTETPL